MSLRLGFVLYVECKWCLDFCNSPAPRFEHELRKCKRDETSEPSGVSEDVQTGNSNISNISSGSGNGKDMGSVNDEEDQRMQEQTSASSIMGWFSRHRSV